VKLDQEQQVVEAALRRRGFRWTNQRAAIVRTALQSHEHFTAEELLALCRRLDPKVSRATVYRTLAVLEEAGFVDAHTRFLHPVPLFLSGPPEAEALVDDLNALLLGSGDVAVVGRR